MGEQQQYHFIRDGRFVCTAPDDAPCRNYSDCECETWNRDLHGQKFGEPIGYEKGHTIYADRDIPPAEGHQPVPQAECWQVPWIEATDLWDTYGEDIVPDFDEFPDGPVDTTFHGDYLTWEYVGPAPTQPSKGDDR